MGRVDRERNVLVSQRLCKTLEYLVAKGPVDGRTRLVKLVYLSDREWYRINGDVYTEAKYYRWNHGPFAPEILAALEWMDGVEIVQKESHSPNGIIYRYMPGGRTRLHTVTLHPVFRGILDQVSLRWHRAPLRELLAHVYGQRDFKNSNFGDPLLRMV